MIVIENEKNRTMIKICGLRREVDIDYVNVYMPDFVGFVFAKSKRQVTVQEAAKLSGMLNDRIKKVGVFVNQDINEVLNIINISNLDVVQLHGDEQPEYILKLRSLFTSRRSQYERSIKIWKAIRVKDYKSICTIKNYKVELVMLDAYSESAYGGMGKVFDWNLAIEAKKYANIGLAGGLNLQNVQKAISVVRPSVIDTSSGVETDGYKDAKKIKEFIQAVRMGV